MNFNRYVLIGLVATLVSSAMAANCVTKRPKWEAQREKCVLEMRIATSTAKQPKYGLFEVKSPALDRCIQNEIDKYPEFVLDDGECNYTPDEREFEGVVKACINRLGGMKKCKDAIASAKENNANVNTVDDIRNGVGATLLMIAAQESDLNAFKFLLDEGASIDLYNLNGWGPLNYLGSHEYIDSDDAYIQQENAEKAANQLEILKLILAANVDVNMRTLEGGAPLSLFLSNHAPENVIKTLLDAGARAAVTYKYGEKQRLSSFHSSVLAGDTAGVRFMMKNKVNPNHADIPSAPLWGYVWAGTENQPKNEQIGDELARILLRGGLNPNGFIDTNQGSSAFVDALRAPAPDDVIQLFLKNKVNVNKLVWNGEPWDAMIKALETDNAELVQTLINSGYNLKKEMMSMTNGAKLNAFEVAILDKKPKAVNVFLKNKANVNRPIAANAGTIYPACYATIVEDNNAILKTLLGAKADPNATCLGSPLLKFAIENLDEETVNILVKAKANVNAKDPSGLSILEIALLEGNQDIINTLKKAGARVPFRGNFVQYCANDHLTEEMINDAINDGADVNDVDENGWTPLHMAAYMVRDPKAVQLLIRKGAFVNAQTKNGLTPFILAVKHNKNPGIMKALASAGADIEALDYSNNNWDALQNAVANNGVDVINTLMNMGVGRFYDDRQKNRLLLIAVINNDDPAVLKNLLKKGLRAEPVNSWWDKPLHVALDKSRPAEIIKILLGSGAIVDDKAMRLARDLPMETVEQKKYRNQIIELLTKAKKKRR